MSSGGVIRFLLGRVIVLPTALVLGGGAAVEGLRKYIPDIPDPGISEAIRRGLEMLEGLKQRTADQWQRMSGDSATARGRSAREFCSNFCFIHTFPECPRVFPTLGLHYSLVSAA